MELGRVPDTDKIAYAWNHYIRHLRDAGASTDVIVEKINSTPWKQWREHFKQQYLDMFDPDQRDAARTLLEHLLG